MVRCKWLLAEDDKPLRCVYNRDSCMGCLMTLFVTGAISNYKPARIPEPEKVKPK